MPGEHPRPVHQEASLAETDTFAHVGRRCALSVLKDIVAPVVLLLAIVGLALLIGVIV